MFSVYSYLFRVILKGIVKKKRSKLSWDEQLQKWVPLYGFKRAAAQKDKDWCLEVPQNVDPMEDQFAKKAEAKSERVAKNELQRLRNIAKSKNVKVPRVGVTNMEVASSKDVSKIIILYILEITIIVYFSALSYLLINVKFSVLSIICIIWSFIFLYLIINNKYFLSSSLML